MFAVRCQQKGLDWVSENSLPAPTWVHGDGAKLSQILINLLGNAVKFTARGQVRFICQAQAENRFYFEVADTGPGIAPQEQASLFQPFQQGTAGYHQEGTGLGLVISQRLIQLMAGQLKLDSQPGQGSRFSFQIQLPPAQPHQAAQVEAQWSAARRLAPGQSVCALIADDVTTNRAILRHLLETLGLTVAEADGGVPALEQLRANPPDIAFLDIRMPDMDGLEVLRRLRREEALHNLKVVAISASVLTHERRAYLDAGFDEFIPKPFRFERICRCLAELLDLEFEFDEKEALVQQEQQTDWSGLDIPADLMEHLQKAARLYSVTELNHHLEQLEALGEEQRQLAEHLKALRQQHDMQAILAVLEEIQAG